ncbi:alpha-amylase [Streptomyces sp. NPDC001027]|uniref:alpha-amylase n=1 Tax=Streptomyces sp. NPDC001027 TaxID=3154771 RepID=UPI003324FB32
MTRPSLRAGVLAVAALAWLLPAAAAAGGVGRAADAAPEPAPDCVSYRSDWRYTIVVNDCAASQDVTVEYLDGQPAPCRRVAPGGQATFAGYGPQLNYVTAVRTCAVAAP